MFIDFKKLIDFIRKEFKELNINIKELKLEDNWSYKFTDELYLVCNYAIEFEYEKNTYIICFNFHHNIVSLKKANRNIKIRKDDDNSLYFEDYQEWFANIKKISRPKL
ncbi:hypothetical protein, partial [Mycoplasmopsis pullorum]